MARNVRLVVGGTVHRRAASIVVLAVLVTSVVTVGSLAGCSSSGSGSPSTSTSAARPAKGVATGTLPATGSVALEGVATPAGSSAGGGLRDFTDVTYTAPSGFQESSDYAPVVPLETGFVDHFLVPTDNPDGKDVIGIYVYTLPTDAQVTPSTDQVARVKAYIKKVHGTISGGINATTAVGLPGYMANVSEPPDYHYVAYFVFGTKHFLEFTCQIATASKATDLALGCGRVLTSMALK